MYGIAGERRLTEWEVPWLPGYEGSRAGAHRQRRPWPAPARRVRRGDGCAPSGAMQAGSPPASPAGPCSRRCSPISSESGPSRRGHLGGARRAQALHLFEGDGVGRLRSRDQERRAVRPRRPARSLARDRRHNPRRRLPARLRPRARQLRASPTAPSSSTPACCCCPMSASCRPTIRACAAPSRRSSSDCWSTASSCATTPRPPTTACRRARAPSWPAASGWSTPICCSIAGRTRGELFERLLALRNDVGLLSEEYDPRTRPAGRQLSAGVHPRRAHQQRVQPDAFREAGGAARPARERGLVAGRSKLSRERRAAPAPATATAPDCRGPVGGTRF